MGPTVAPPIARAHPSLPLVLLPPIPLIHAVPPMRGAVAVPVAVALAVALPLTAVAVAVAVEAAALAVL